MYCIYIGACIDVWMRVFKRGFNIIKNYISFDSLRKKNEKLKIKRQVFNPFRYFLTKKSFFLPLKSYFAPHKHALLLKGENDFLKNNKHT